MDAIIAINRKTKDATQIDWDQRRYEIAKYGADHKKEWAIHTQPHNSKKAQKKGEAIDGPHIHRWENGRALKPERFSPNDPRIALLQRVQNFQKTKK